MYMELKDELFEQGTQAEIDEYIDRQLALIDRNTQEEEYYTLWRKIMIYRWPKDIRDKLFDPELDEAAKEVFVLAQVKALTEEAFGACV